MLKNYWYFIIILICSIANAGCCKKKVYCQPDKLNFAVAGYPRYEVRTMIIKKYKPGESGKALDSAIFTYAGNKPVVPNRKDTLYFSEYVTNSATLRSIYPGNDWTIYFQAIRENHHIIDVAASDHYSEKVKCGDNSSTCLNPVAHFMVNGAWKEGGFFWIAKQQ